jgi:hypothetical protein
MNNIRGDSKPKQIILAPSLNSYQLFILHYQLFKGIHARYIHPCDQ